MIADKNLYELKRKIYSYKNMLENESLSNVKSELNEKLSEALAEYRTAKKLASYKQYRLSHNPMEQRFHDEFVFEHGCQDMSMLVFPPNNNGMSPTEYLTEREEKIVMGTIQWLGSPVGSSFLQSLGYTKNEL